MYTPENKGACRFDMATKLKASDIRHLSTLKSKAKTGSSTSRCADFILAVAAFGVAFAFAVAFYRIALISDKVKDLNAIGQSHTLNGGRNVTTEDAMSQSSGIDPLATLRECHCSAERMRRSVTESDKIDDTVADNESYVDSQATHLDLHLAIHLIPHNTTSTVKVGDFLKWTNARIYSDASLEDSVFQLHQRGTHLMVLVPGSYFLYSQVTLSNSISRPVGYMINSRGCRTKTKRTIFSTSVTQGKNNKRHGPWDSSYTGGVAYLSAGDIIFVEPKYDGITPFINVSSTKTATFFGAFLISHDDGAPTLRENCPEE